MPPVSQQNSRAGLITAVVIFTILFVTATIFAIYYGVEATRLQKDYADLKSKYIPRIIPEGGLTSPVIAELEAARSDPNSGLPASMALLDVAVKQRDNLAQTITGTAGSSPADAQAAAAGALAAAKDRTKGASLTLPTSDNLAGAVKTLADAVASRAEQVQNLQAQVEQTQKEKAQLIADVNKALEQKNQDIANIRAQMEKSTADVAAYSASKDQTVAGIEKNNIVGSPGRHRQLLRRVPKRFQNFARNPTSALFRDHLQGELPSHASPHRSRARHRVARTDHG